uniref:Uncharacterized protein n=1 Tax=Anopheles melas TaxID=34690 RepID=A0A182TSP4_9DIPT
MHILVIHCSFSRYDRGQPHLLQIFLRVLLAATAGAGCGIGGAGARRHHTIPLVQYRAHVLRHQRVVRPLGVGGVQAEKVGREQMLVVRPQLVLLLQAADDERVKIRAELVCVRVGRLGQPGRIVLHHLLELLERRPPGRVREAAGRDLHHRDAERPDVRLDVVAGGPAARARIDPLRRHHVRRLHVPVDDAQLGVQVVQGAHDRERYLAQDVLRDGAPGALVHHRVELVHARVHHLHADPHVALAEQRPVELDGVAAVARPHRHVQVHQQALLLLRLDATARAAARPHPARHRDALDRHHRAGRLVQHLLDDAVRPPAQIRQLAQMVRLDHERPLAD